MGSRGASSQTGAITEIEKEAIEEYVSGNFMWINQFLRGRGDFGELSKEEEKLLKALSRTTNKKLGPTTLYRSVDAEAIFGNMTEGQYENLRDMLVYGEGTFGKGAYAQGIVNDLKALINRTEGKTIHEKGFMSATKSYDVANEWGDFTGSDKPVVLAIKTGRYTKGKDVSYTDANAGGQEQHEVLLRRDQDVKVNRIRSRDGQIYIEVEMK